MPRASPRANETLTAEQCANFSGTLEIERLRNLAKKLKLTVADLRALPLSPLANATERVSAGE